MEDTKKPHPFGICTRCGTCTWDMEALNQPCTQVVNNRKCEGAFREALEPDDWMGCPICSATGGPVSDPCTQCYGAGWLYVRKR
jgi:hypothetical protein